MAVEHQFRIGKCVHCDTKYKLPIRNVKCGICEKKLLAEETNLVFCCDICDTRYHAKCIKKLSERHVEKPCIRCYNVDSDIGQVLYENAIKMIVMLSSKFEGRLMSDLDTNYRDLYESALSMMIESSDKGYSHAQNHLGSMYFKGDLLDHNYEKAIELFELAAEQDNVEALFNLGMVNFHGEHVTHPDHEKAFKYFSGAARFNDITSLYYQGMLYYEGNGTEKNYEKAYESWNRAVEKSNHPKSMFRIGHLYYKGEGVVKNEGEALRWWNRASENGCVEAQKSIDKLYKKKREEKLNNSK